MPATGWEHAVDPRPDDGRDGEAFEALVAALRRSLADPATLKRARAHVRERYGHELDADDPAADVAHLCVARCMRFADDAVSDGPQVADVPAAVRELRAALDAIKKWTGGETPDNARLRAAVDAIAREDDPDKAHDLLLALWDPTPGPTTTSRYAALADELRATLTAAGLPNAPRHAAWLIERVCGGGEAFAAECARLDERIEAIAAELDDPSYRLKQRAMRHWTSPQWGAPDALDGVKDEKLLTAVNDEALYRQFESGELGKALDALPAELARLKAQRAALRRWVPPGEAAIKQTIYRPKK